MTTGTLPHAFNSSLKMKSSLNIRTPLFLIAAYFTIAFYWFKVFVIGPSVDIFETDRSYYQWIEAIKVLPMSIDSISAIYFSSLEFISAPEPISSYLTFIAYKAFPRLPEDLYLHILNVLYIALSIFLIFKSRISSFLVFLLLLGLSIGYYEFTVMHSTHRFKIAVIFIIVSMLIKKDHPRLSQSALALACLTHFSLLAMLPVLWLLRRSGFSSAPVPPFLSMFILGAAFILLITFSVASNAGDMEAFQEAVLLFVNNKLSHAGFDVEKTLYLLLAAIFLVPIFDRIFLKIKPRIIVYLLGAYLLLALLVVGTSTLLFSFYMMLTPILISVYREQSAVNKKYISLFVSTIGFYSVYKGLILAPIPLYFDFL